MFEFFMGVIAGTLLLWAAVEAREWFWLEKERRLREQRRAIEDELEAQGWQRPLWSWQ